MTITMHDDAILPYIRPFLGRCSTCGYQLPSKQAFLMTNTYWCPFCEQFKHLMTLLNPALFSPYDEAFRIKMQDAINAQLRRTKANRWYRNVDYARIE